MVILESEVGSVEDGPAGRGQGIGEGVASPMIGGVQVDAHGHGGASGSGIDRTARVVPGPGECQHLKSHCDPNHSSQVLARIFQRARSFSFAAP